MAIDLKLRGKMLKDIETITKFSKEGTIGILNGIIKLEYVLHPSYDENDWDETIYSLQPENQFNNIVKIDSNLQVQLIRT